VSVEQLRPLIRQLAHTAEIHAFNWMLQYEPTVEDLQIDIPEMLDVYVQSAALLAANWYNEQDDESTYFALPVEGIADDRLENTAAWVHRGPQRPENRMRVAAHTLVFDASRNTVYQNAKEEGVAIVRHEMGDACEDCATRATLAPKARNSSSEDISTDFHPSCEGMYVPVRRGVWEPPSHARVWRSRIADARRSGAQSAEDIAKWLASN
jgi:hypothetical protein